MSKLDQVSTCKDMSLEILSPQIRATGSPGNLDSYSSLFDSKACAFLMQPLFSSLRTITVVFKFKSTTELPGGLIKRIIATWTQP